MDPRTLDLFFAAIRYELTGQAIDPSLADGLSEASIGSLIELSQTHDLSHIVYRSLSACGLWPKEDAHTAAMERTVHMAQYRYLLMESTLGALRSALTAAAIDFVPLKGSVLRHLYPHPYLRVSCDIDLLVRPTDIDRACDVLSHTLGFERRGASSHDISFFTAENVHVELHFSLVETANPQPSDAVLSRIFDFAFGESCEKQLTPEAFYLYHVAHMAKHVMDGGCGVRPFLDMYVLRSVSRDASACETLLSEASLTTFADVCERLTDVWLQGATHDDATRSLAAYLLSGGVYGTLENSVRLSKVRRGGRLRFLLSKMFLPYRVLARDYPVLRRHPYLFPLMQVVRWFRLVFSKDKKRVLDTVRHSRTTEADETLAEQIRRWGL